MKPEEAIEELENATLLIIANGKDWMDEGLDMISQSGRKEGQLPTA